MRKNAIIKLYTGAQTVEQLHDIKIAKKTRETQLKQNKKIITHIKESPIYIE
jgi:hypothetical protein